MSKIRIGLKPGVLSYTWKGIAMLPKKEYVIDEEDLMYVRRFAKLIRKETIAEIMLEPIEPRIEPVPREEYIGEMVNLKLRPDIRSITIQVNDQILLMKPGVIYTIPYPAEGLGKIPMHCEVMGQEFVIIKKDVLKVLAPDGIGDLHWLFLKLGALVKACEAKSIHLYIRDLSPTRPRRSQEFVTMNPLISDVTFTKDILQAPPWGFICKPNQYDYYLDPTPILQAGRRIEEWIPSLAVDYFYPLNLPEYKLLNCSAVYFGDSIAEKVWANGWGDAEWATIVKVLRKKAPVVLLGLDCDREKADAVKRLYGVDTIDMIGQTSFAEAFKLAMGSKVLVGSISGLTMLPASRGGRVVALWPGKESKLKLPESMRTSWIQNNDFYRPLGYGSDVTSVLRAALSLWRGK